MTQKHKDRIEKADCGHYELIHRIVRQLGKTNCRDCQRKINTKLSRIVRKSFNKQRSKK